MALSPGTRLGRYQVAAEIGAGGMREVYRATDPDLKRDVAIKVLPAMLASDPERLTRFQREAEILASLNHPNIAIIYGSRRLTAFVRSSWNWSQDPTWPIALPSGLFRLIRRCGFQSRSRKRSKPPIRQESSIAI